MRSRKVDPAIGLVNSSDSCDPQNAHFRFGGYENVVRGMAWGVRPPAAIRVQITAATEWSAAQIGSSAFLFRHHRVAPSASWGRAAGSS
jgi:hypothetical protein